MTSLLVDYDAYSREYNMWRDECAEFVADYSDHPSIHTVATTIVRVVETALQKSYDDPNHAFNRYGTDEKVFNELLNVLAADVRAEIQSPTVRQHVVSFFHSGGPYHDALTDLFESFLDFRDTSVCSDEEEDDEDDEEDEEDEEETQDPNAPPQVQWSWGPNEVQSAEDWLNNPNGPPF
jgi:hypothetical protein